MVANDVTNDLDELWRGLAIILAWAMKRYGPRVIDRLLAFVIKHGGERITLTLSGSGAAVPVSISVAAATPASVDGV